MRISRRYLLSGVNYFFSSTTTISPYQRQLLFNALRRREAPAAGRRAKPARGPGFSFRRKGIRGGGKVGNLLLVFHFSIRLLPLELWKCGNLACPWRDFQGAVERGGSLLLAFHAFHSPVISTALFLACFWFWPPTAIIRPPCCFPPVDSSWRAPPGNSGCSAQ